MNKKLEGITLIGEILIMISAFIWCFTIIGMIWGIPMIMGCKKRINGEKEITISHLIISFLFYWFLGAILSTVGWSSDNK